MKRKRDDSDDSSETSSDDDGHDDNYDLTSSMTASQIIANTVYVDSDGEEFTNDQVDQMTMSEEKDQNSQILSDEDEDEDNSNNVIETPMVEMQMDDDLRLLIEMAQSHASSLTPSADVTFVDLVIMDENGRYTSINPETFMRNMTGSVESLLSEDDRAFLHRLMQPVTPVPPVPPVPLAPHATGTSWVDLMMADIGTAQRPTTMSRPVPMGYLDLSLPVMPLDIHLPLNLPLPSSLGLQPIPADVLFARQVMNGLHMPEMHEPEVRGRHLNPFFDRTRVRFFTNEERQSVVRGEFQFSEEDYERAELHFHRLMWESSSTGMFVNVHVNICNAILEYYFRANQQQWPTWELLCDMLLHETHMFVSDLPMDRVRNMYHHYCVSNGCLPDPRDYHHIIEFHMIHNQWPTEEELQESRLRHLRFFFDPERFHSEDKMKVPTLHVDQLPVETNTDPNACCSICMDDIALTQTCVKLLPCGHVFHANENQCLQNSSIFTWLRENNVCPNCKSKVSPADKK